ncbi:hypothetical protein [Arthrobacter flavus]|uniref:Alpha/beta hydrolase n=1 Tax=Arthrobacter flavus TaxID=95172 RepID=A0ABW4QAS6_9MICC
MVDHPENTEPSSTNWDSRHEVPIFRVAGISEIVHPGNHKTRYISPSSIDAGLDLDFLYEPESSSTLVVVLHGALGRNKFVLPRFEWRSTLQNVRASKLYLSDSTVSQSANLEIGWYFGQQKDDLVERYSALVRHIKVIGSYQRVLFVGSSAGGFAALSMSRKIADSCAVAFSPQTTIAAYHPGHVRKFSDVVFPNFGSFDRIERDFGMRINLRRLYDGTENLNYFRFVQNIGDPFHYEGHYVPFALAQGVSPEGAGPTPSGRGRFVVARYEKGHAPPPRSYFRRHISEAHEEFFGGKLVIE